jgi:hypothetical protein
MFNQTAKTVAIRGNEVIGSFRYDASYNIENGSVGNVQVKVTELDEAGKDKSEIGTMTIKDEIEIKLVNGSDLATHVTNFSAITTEIDASLTAQ